MFSLFFLHVLSKVQTEDFVIKTYNSCPGQQQQYFSIKKIQLFHPFHSRGIAAQLTLVAELNQKVQEPYLEIQLTNQRIPLIRKRDNLCRPGILICPASFSQLIYGCSIPIPSTIPFGEYKLKLLFKEGQQSLSCYEIPISLKKMQIPDELDEQNADD